MSDSKHPLELFVPLNEQQRQAKTGLEQCIGDLERQNAEYAAAVDNWAIHARKLISFIDCNGDQPDATIIDLSANDGDGSSHPFRAELRVELEKMLQIDPASILAEHDVWAKAEANRLYYELLYAVVHKYPGESRHETVLRYIEEREGHSGETAAAQTENSL